MRTWTGIVMLVATTAFTPLQQPVPAAAPAGATGLCKDGTYETRAVKSGACSGHKGVKTWYAAKGTAAKTATAPATAAAATPKMAATKPAMAPAPTAAMKPAPVTPPAAAATPKPMSAKKTASAAAPGGGPGLVWVNSSSKIYHCFGTTEYGRTKKGSYMSEADAKTAGNRAARNKACAP